MTDTDITTKAGFFSTARKAVAAAVAAFTSAAGPAIVVATADGAFNFGTEGVPILIVALGLATAAFFGVYAIPNAKA